MSRPTGVLLQRLDLTVDDLPVAVGVAPDGTVYLICTEGVGWEVKDEGFEGKSPEDLQDLTTGELVDLADWVRVFGARLESNFWLWFNRLGGER